MYCKIAMWEEKYLFLGNNWLDIELKLRNLQVLVLVLPPFGRRLLLKRMILANGRPNISV